MRPRSRRGRIVAALLAAVVVVLVVAQLVLPPIATSVVRTRLGKSAKITSIKLSAFPAIKLLWGSVDQLDLVLRSYNLEPDELSGKIKQSGEASTLNASIGTLNVGALSLHSVTLHKQNGKLDLTGRLQTEDLRRALPIIQSLTPVAGIGGELTLRGTVAAFGASAKITATVAARDGKVVVAPQGLLGAFATVTVFADPHVFVQSISGRAVPGGLQIAVQAEYR